MSKTQKYENYLQQAVNELAKTMPEPPTAEVPQEKALPQVQPGPTMPMMQFAPGVSAPLDLQTVMNYFTASQQIQNQPLQNVMQMRAMGMQENRDALNAAQQRYNLNKANYLSPFEHQVNLHKAAILPSQSAEQLLRTDLTGTSLEAAQQQLQWEREDRPRNVREQDMRLNLLQSQARTAAVTARYAPRDARLRTEYARAQNELIKSQLDSLKNMGFDPKVIQEDARRYAAESNIYLDDKGSVDPQAQAKWENSYIDYITNLIREDPRQAQHPRNKEAAKDYANYQVHIAPGIVQSDWLETQSSRGSSIWPWNWGKSVKSINEAVMKNPELYYTSENYMNVGQMDRDYPARAQLKHQLFQAIQDRRIRGIVPISLSQNASQFGLAIMDNDGTFVPINVGEKPLVYDVALAPDSATGPSDLARELWDLIPVDLRDKAYKGTLHTVEGKADDIRNQEPTYPLLPYNFMYPANLTR